MAEDIRMPKLGISMTEGTLVEWLVAEGDAVAAGTPIYRLETDKVENEVEAPVAGRIMALVAAGETYGVGVKLAHIEEG